MKPSKNIPGRSTETPHIKTVRPGALLPEFPAELLALDEKIEPAGGRVLSILFELDDADREAIAGGAGIELGIEQHDAGEDYVPPVMLRVHE